MDSFDLGMAFGVKDWGFVVNFKFVFVCSHLRLPAWKSRLRVQDISKVYISTHGRFSFGSDAGEPAFHSSEEAEAYLTSRRDFSRPTDRSYILFPFRDLEFGRRKKFKYLFRLRGSGLEPYPSHGNPRGGANQSLTWPSLLQQKISMSLLSSLYKSPITRRFKSA